MHDPATERPDPDALLRTIEAASQHAGRGTLRVYFGASAGVGKTYAMLAAARAQLTRGIDVAAGVIETHGRRETAALLEGLEVLPQVDVPYRGHVLKEFDLDGALRRKPALILVDELAHSNAPGSRHAKRWQDVEELLAAGISVWTTLNAQHLESLNDAVGSITGVRVWETVPDQVFDGAAEVILVDLPADELLRRLRDGKVYMPDQARHATRNFFRKGNLIALRELALRRTADRVDDDVQAYRRDSAIQAVWRTREAVVACVAADVDAEYIVRGAHRLAQQLECDLHVVTIDTPRVSPMIPEQRGPLRAALTLAESLGAHVETLAGADMVHAVVAYVRRHNITKAVIGRSGGGAVPGLRGTLSAWLSAALSPIGPWRRKSFADQLAAGCAELDVIRLAAPANPGLAQGNALPLALGRRNDTGAAPGTKSAGRPVSTSTYTSTTSSAAFSAASPGTTSRIPAASPATAPAAPSRSMAGYAWTVAYCVIATVVSNLLFPTLEQTNIVMFYLLAVVAVAVRHGRGPAALASFISVAAFDFFFVQPYRSFAVSDVQYLLTFVVLLAVGLLVGQLTAGLRLQAQAAAKRESEARGLYEFARELSSALLPEQIVASAVSFVHAAFDTPCALLLMDAQDRLQLGNADTPLELDPALGLWVFDHGQPAGAGTATLSSSPLLYLPLKAPMRTRGVLAIRPPGGAAFATSDERRQLDAYATLIAIAIERLHYVEVAQQALISMESEKLRNSLLAAVSHDLRTPLTSLIGMSETLLRGDPALANEQREIAQAMRQQANRMHALVVNLLDMARLQNRDVALSREWQSVEELVGAAIADTREPLRRHGVTVAPLSQLPLVECDGALIERVLCNLLENAAKYTPPGSKVHIDALALPGEMRIRVADDGEGVPAGKEQEIFDKFVRGERESATPGVGLGLAVCQAIMGAHHGRIWAERGEAPYAGARFVLFLPLGKPPDPYPEPA